MALPSITAEIAFDSGFATAEGDRTWTDVSEYVEQAVDITYGRADELSTPDPNTLSLTLDNRDGRFTPANTSSPYYPNVKKGKPVRVSVRYAEDGSGNFLSANAASMETDISAWSAGGSVPPTLASSTTHVDNGTKALRITWGTGGSFPLAQTTVSNLVVGRIYTAQARVWVTAGTPDIELAVAGIGTGTATSTKGAFATISYTFTATASSHLLQVWPNSAPTAGQQCWVDSVMVDEGSSVGTFTTNPPPSSVRFTGYVNEWPVMWPNGTGSTANVTITASSRRARLGQTAPLTSAIRAAYLATDPLAYWPMDEDAETVDRAGRQTFRDITNTVTLSTREREMIGSFTTTVALSPVVQDGTQGPTDETSLVRLPPFTDSGLIGTFAHYVGAGGVISINPSGGLTMEAVARISPSGNGGNVVTNVMGLYSSDLLDQIALGATSDISGDAALGTFTIYNHTTFALLDSQAASGGADEYASVTDGDIHHWAATLSSGGVLKFYLDGVLIGTVTAASPFATRFTQVTFGENTLNSTLWVGHGAVHTRELTAAEIADHAAAATASSETDGERVVRVAGRIGVPEDEIDVETSLATSLGPQPESGRSAAEVLDELASSTGGVLYDTRDGHLALQARNHRYNQAAAFSLSGTTQEFEADLTATSDDRYLVNTVEVTRTGAVGAPVTLRDDDSIDAYGIYAQSLTVATDSDEEALSAAQNMIFRFADPDPRISQVSVDIVNHGQRADLLEADIGTLFNISALPTQAPSAAMALFLEGYSESITAESHILTMNTTPGDLYTNVAILDNASHDVLDSGITLAY